MQPWVLLEDTQSTQETLPGWLFEGPIQELICWEPTQLAEQLQAMDNLRRQGFYLVGFIAYEAGYVFNGLQVPAGSASDQFPLMHFLVFSHCTRLNAEDIHATLSAKAQYEPDDYAIKNLQLSVTYAQYVDLFRQVQCALREGDTYQVNLTSKYTFDLEGSSLRLYQQLRACQRVAYSGVLAFADYTLLSLSPELFFSKTGTCMRTKPMKGTCQRSQDRLLDAVHRQLLRTDSKSIAENIMIVDLLRNDLSKLSYPGSVSTPQLLHIETYETLHQLVSCVESVVDIELDLYTIIRHLFPCGSVTGAPKQRTMAIIEQLELAPRRVYTGAIGYVMPNNDMCFNVSIRTLLLKDGQGELGVGGGIVQDSEVMSEFNEMQLKARYFTQWCN